MFFSRFQSIDSQPATERITFTILLRSKPENDAFEVIPLWRAFQMNASRGRNPSIPVERAAVSIGLCFHRFRSTRSSYFSHAASPAVCHLSSSEIVIACVASYFEVRVSRSLWSFKGSGLRKVPNNCLRPVHLRRHWQRSPRMC